MTVIYLAQRKATELSTPNFASLDPQGLFDIPWKDIVCFKDSANRSKGDPIELGAASRAALERLYQEFGIPGLPTTWGQLMGSVAYCTELSTACNYPRVSPADDAQWFAAVLKVARRYSPELVRALIAYDAKNLDALTKVFIADIGFEACSKHFDPSTGWDSFPETREHS